MLTRKMCLSAMMSGLHVSFSLLHSAIDCLRVARSSKGHSANLQALELAISEGQLPYTAKLSRGETFAVGIEKDRSRENVCGSSISQ